MTVPLNEAPEASERTSPSQFLDLAEDVPISEVPAPPAVETPPQVTPFDAVDEQFEDATVDDPPLAAAVPPDPDARRAQLALYARISQYTAVALVAALFLLVLGVQVAEGDQIRSGVTAFGVDLSGMTRDEATEAISAAVATQSRQTLKLTDGEGEWLLSRDALGVRVDIAGVVDDAFAQGRSGWGPSRLALLWHLRDGETRVGQQRVAVDPAALNAELATIAADIEQPKIEAVLSVTADAQIHYIPSQVGRTLNIAASETAVLAALASGASSGTLVVDETHPLRPDSLYTAAKSQLENILDAPVEIVAADQVWTLTPAQISYWLVVVQPQNGQPAELRINEQWIWDIVDEIAWAVDRDPKSARVWWAASGALVQTRPGEDGRTVDQAASEALIMDVFLGRNPANRIELPVSIENMTNLPADLNSLGVNSLIAEASTPYGGSLPARMHNIELAASLLNGTFIMPGQTFSFNAEIGSTSTAAGFQVAYGIDSTGGAVTTVPSVGGGICQVATTVFQPVFWAGYEINERNTHSYWISRYETRGMPGLDATVDEASGLDFQWTNNTSTAVLLEAVANGEDFIVRLYGTVPNWEVQVDAPVITNQKPADNRTHYEPTFDLPEGATRQVEHAADGFDVSIIRRVISGDQVSQMEFIAHYLPARNVVLVGTTDGTLPPEYAALNNDEYVEEPSEYVEETDVVGEPEVLDEGEPTTTVEEEVPSE
ncbi:MAG: hypothetical protein DCC58_13400 [Chloroflexi bacterium]|nr:MAG: hypothetical protein DCC58_13400 [Chloroflexota bacterium]